MKLLKNLFILLVFVKASTVLAQYTLTNAFPNLTFPRMTEMVNAHDGTNRIFVVTQNGVIFVFPNTPTASNPKVFLDLSDRVSQNGSETGLLGLAFHPNFSSNKYFYVDYTQDTPQLHSVISRFTVSTNNPDSAVKSSEFILLTVNQPYTNHKGGKLSFGADGYLYIAFGDGGSAGDPLNNAQNRAVLLGKILRIDVNSQSGGNNYSIPPTNPYYQNTLGYRQEIWTYGMRNPWRFSFDPVTNKLWCGDVGQNLYEEIDILYPGNNYGWRIMEGYHCYNPPTGCDSTGLTIPIWEYPHTQNNCSITGGYVYRGSIVPLLTGKYIYGDYCTGMIWSLAYDSINPTVNTLLVIAGFPISTFGVDQNNELYVCKYNTTGSIYKFNPLPIEVKRINNQIPEKFLVYQNYPNPFNPSTKIKFDVPKSSNISNGIEVELSIYNYLGEKITDLLNNKLSPGSYEITWSGSNYPSGVYIYRLSFNGKSYSKKMVLTK